MAVTKAGVGGSQHPPFANITLPYKGHQYTDHQLAIQLLLQENTESEKPRSQK